MGKDLPAIHGADHLLFGPDPIPGVGKVERARSGGSLTTSDPFALHGGLLTWEHHDGDTLLDYTDTSRPVFIQAGVYAFTIVANPSAALTTDAYWEFNVTVGTATPNWAVGAVNLAQAASGTPPRSIVSGVWTCLGGDEVTAQISTDDQSTSVWDLGECMFVRLW